MKSTFLGLIISLALTFSGFSAMRGILQGEVKNADAYAFLLVDVKGDGGLITAAGIKGDGTTIAIVERYYTYAGYNARKNEIVQWAYQPGASISYEFPTTGAPFYDAKDPSYVFKQKTLSLGNDSRSVGIDDCDYIVSFYVLGPFIYGVSWPAMYVSDSKMARDSRDAQNRVWWHEFTEGLPYNLPNMGGPLFRPAPYQVDAFKTNRIYPLLP